VRLFQLYKDQAETLEKLISSKGEVELVPLFKSDKIIALKERHMGLVSSGESGRG